MSQLKETDLTDILSDIEALQTAMLLTINGSTEDHGKWVNFKRFADEYNDIVGRFYSGQDVQFNVYNTASMRSHLDTLWPTQKSIFEQVYQDVLKLHGRIRSRLRGVQPQTGFDDLLHPEIRGVAIAHYQSGSFRNAVLDAIVAIFDRIRSRTGLDLDGDRLCNSAFSVSNPLLIFSEIDTDSGRNDQVGFMEILKGVYRGVRNPKSHSLSHDLDYLKTAQYLVMLSLLMRRIDTAIAVVSSEPTDS
jgi:uncharacterized protein (TIGR02391 family)